MEAVVDIKRSHEESEKKVPCMEKLFQYQKYQDFLNYKIARNLASEGVRNAKRKFEKNLASAIKKNPKCFWKYVRSKTKVKTGINDLECEDGSFARRDKDKADV